LFDYPAGTIAGFVIEDLGLLLEAELFETLTISTYLDGEEQESMSGDDLLDLAVIVLFISDEPGRYNVGFEATESFDEIRITIGSLVSAINVIRVYSAFVDTRSSEGNGLMCNDPPVALPDVETTPENTPVTIVVLENDDDPDDFMGIPMVYDSTSHGMVMMNPDSTFTYTPDSNFVGLDSFYYEICDPSDMCDSALVIINVIPVIDTVYETIPEDSMITFCANELTTFTEPATSISGCGPPEHGMAIINMDCITYAPDDEFSGQDTFCVYTCHPDNPTLCDTTIIVITVTPIDDQPLAVDDNETTNEDTPLMGSAQTNDTPSEDGGNTWTLDGPDGGAQHGDVSMNPDGTYTYTPDPDYNGPDSFDYIVCDVDGDCDTATVFITVDPINDLPLAEDDVETTPEDTPIVSNVHSNDTPSGDGGNTWMLVGVNGGAMHGTVDFQPDGSYTYTPDLNFSGSDSFTYQVCDVDNDCDIAVVNITIESVCENLIVSVFMEGPYEAGPAMTTWLNYYHILPGQDPTESDDPLAAILGVPTPIGQPYNTAPWNYAGTEGDTYGDPATNPGSIPYPETVTDWVLVSLRNDVLEPGSTFWKCAGLVHSDGHVEFPDDCPCLQLGTTDVYILVEHRNHLAVMSLESTPTATTVGFDFTMNDSWKFDIGSPQEVTQKMIGGAYVMYGANGEQVATRIDIVSADEAIWLTENSLIYTYLNGDHSLNGDVNSFDEAIWLINVSLFNFIAH
jgi:hypothetical protein